MFICDLFTSSEFRPQDRRIPMTNRRGAIVVLVTILLVVFIVIAALIVDVAHMLLVKTELQVSTDAAAMAGAESLHRTENQQDARRAAVDFAKQNNVAGLPLILDDDDIEFGGVARSENGTWRFDRSLTPKNSLKINGRHESVGFFAPAVGVNSFSTSQTAVAAHVDVEIVLCIDRSASMAWKISELEGVGAYDTARFPDNHPMLNPFEDFGEYFQLYVSPPHSTESRWGALDRAVQLFLDEVGQSEQPPRVGLVTWSDDLTVDAFTISLYPELLPSYPGLTVNTPLPSDTQRNWALNRTAIENQLATIGSGFLFGETKMSAGLDQAIALLTSADMNEQATKIIILMTDGAWNVGENPIESAITAASHHIVIHTVNLLSDAAAIDLVQIADITGGEYYRADDELELRDAFVELSQTLPVSLIQ